MKYLIFVFALVVVQPAFADHSITDLEGEWYSSIFPENTRYHFFGIQPEGIHYVVRHTRGACIGSGLLNLETGHLRTVEVCPPKAAGGEERVFVNIWHLIEDHDEHHLRGGYYSAGSSTFYQEDLDFNPHGSHPPH